MARLMQFNEATAARRRVYFHCVDATDGISPETGEAGGQPQVSSDGAAFTNTGIGVLVHLGNGRYYGELTQTLVLTEGTHIETRYKSANTAETPGDSVDVIAYDPYDAVRLGLTALPNAAADAAGGLPISDAGGLDLDLLLGDAVTTAVSVEGTTQTFRVTAGPAGNNAMKELQVTVYDANALGSIETRRITSWNTERDIVVDAAFSFTPEVGDVVRIHNAYLGSIALCDLVTANTDMRGTDGANQTTPNTVVPLVADKNLAYLQILGRSDAAIETDRSTEIGELNADEGSGVGDFDNTADSQEALAAGLALIVANYLGFILADTNELQTDDVPGLIAASDIINVAKLDRNADLIESQRGAHTWQGDYYYVDPVNGDTHANGNRGGRLDPYLTIQDCHDNAVTDSNHDVIFLVAGASAGVTTHTVAVTTTLSKRYLQIRGPGRDFIITRTGNGDTIEVTAEGIGLSGFQLGTAATGSGDGVQVTDSDFFRMENCWVLDTQGDGIQGTRVSNMQIINNHFQGTGVDASGEGIHIDGTGAGNSINNVIRDNHFASTGGDAILIENGTIIDTSIENNIIHGAGGWGINIAADSSDAIVSNNILGNNASGDIQDNGTTTVLHNNEQIQDQVWDETLTAATHNIATSSGRRLRDIASPVVITGTSPGGGGNQSIVLDGDASAVDGTYDPSVILITGGTGVGQSRQIMEYNGSIKTAYVKRDWKVNPDATSTYTILASAGDTHINEGLAQAGGATSITLNALASSVDDTYIDQIVFIVSGAGQDQARSISAYNGTSKVATVIAWDTQPDATSVYIMLPAVVSKTGLSLSAAGVDAIWAKAMSDLAQGAPSATASVLTAINYQFMAWRNKLTSTDTLQTLFRDDGTTELTRTVISDDDTTFTKAEKTTGQ